MAILINGVVRQHGKSPYGGGLTRHPACQHRGKGFPPTRCEGSTHQQDVGNDKRASEGPLQAKTETLACAAGSDHSADPITDRPGGDRPGNRPGSAQAVRSDNVACGAPAGRWMQNRQTPDRYTLGLVGSAVRGPMKWVATRRQPAFVAGSR